MNKKVDLQGTLNMVVGMVFYIESFFTIHLTLRVLL